jgi:hypothetical protein
MQKWLFALGFILLFGYRCQAQQLTDSTRLYLLTCAPGAELFSKFGHSAIRAHDPTTGTDLVFNYGIFDFDTPNFYVKFIRGKLNYMLGVQRTEVFLRAYESEGRRIDQQALVLNQQETQRVIDFLRTNYEPQNRYYLYDFFYDNCATRIRDVIERAFDTTLEPPATYSANKSFRQLLDEYIGPFPWADFGIDLILGLPADHTADFRDEMFLPDYLSAHFATTSFRNQNLTPAPEVIVPARIDHLEPSGGIGPVWLFGVLAVIVLILTLFAPPKVGQILGSIFFLAAGLAGCLFAFMWIGTDHQATWQNLNLLWASPLWLFVLDGRNQWQRILLLVACTTTTVAIVGYLWLPQQLHPAILPIAIILLIRGMLRLRDWSKPANPET